MQSGIIRLAYRTWHLSLTRIMALFDRYRVLYYIEGNFGIFHTEGDNAVLDDIEHYLGKNGVTINAAHNDGMILYYYTKKK